MFGDIISSKIVRLAFWHWTLELGFTRLNAQWPSLRHFQRFDSPFIVYYYISFDLWNYFLELWIFKNFCWNFFRILMDFLKKFFGIFFPSKIFRNFKILFRNPGSGLTQNIHPCSHTPWYVKKSSWFSIKVLTASNIGVKKSARVDRFGDHLSTGTKCDGDHSSIGTNCLGDLMSLGTKWTGTICLLGPNVSGDQMSSGPNVSQPKFIWFATRPKSGTLLETR